MAKAVAAGDMLSFLRCDGELNAAAAQAARNEIAARTVATLHSVSRRFWFFHHEQWAGADATMRLHVDLAKALASGSEDEAAAASDRLIDDLADFARSTVAS